MKDYNIINIELIKQIQTGNKESWEELIKNNIGIINKRVNYFSERTKYLTPEDLFQEAVIGLYQAAIRYDLSRDNTFLTYALYYINQAIMHKIRNFDNLIRIPVNIQSAYMKYFSCDPTGSKSIKDKCKENNWDEKELRYFLTMYRIPLSLDKITEDSEDTNMSLYELIKDDSSPEIEDIMVTRNLKQIVEKCVKDCLTEKEIYVIKSRYEDNLTLEETGKALGVTRERVRQIEVKAIRKLRVRMYRKTSIRGEIPTLIRE